MLLPLGFRLRAAPSIAAVRPQAKRLPEATHRAAFWRCPLRPKLARQSTPSARKGSYGQRRHCGRGEAGAGRRDRLGESAGTIANGIHALKGIPYGASTAGHNRFRAPQPALGWSGVRAATGFAGRAWQLPNRPARRAVLETLLGPADTTAETEDCLTLNLWTPGLGDGGKRPVMVWLHGGAFAYGSANRAVTDGANLARRGDVVVVAVNHRLNILGFLHLDDIGGGRWMHASNAGILDIVAALQWVRDNIAAFGGDVVAHPLQ